MENFLIHDRPMSPKDWGVDVAVAVAAFLVGCAQLMLSVSSIVIPDFEMRQYLGLVNVVPSVSMFVALAITTIPLVVRRRFPWPVYLFVTVAFLGLQNAYTDFSLSIVGPVVALYTIACERSRAEAVVATVLAVGGLLVVNVSSRTASFAFFTRATNITLMVAAALAGYAYSTHRAYVKATEQRAIEAERTREEEAARRVEEERVRIAREVHDITAHSLSAVSVQAAAAERLIDNDPKAAKEAITAVRTTAKGALDDIRSMIGVLRHGDDPIETTPTAGTDRLDDLVTFMKNAGVDASLDVADYDRSLVPAHVDMALYGIAREAVTNIVRHADAKTVSICLGLEGEWARLVVEDDGKGCGTPEAMSSVSGGRRSDTVLCHSSVPLTHSLPQAADGAGHGIAGMAERVHVLGGMLSAGDVPAGGFRISASLPVKGERS